MLLNKNQPTKIFYSFVNMSIESPKAAENDNPTNSRVV